MKNLTFIPIIFLTFLFNGYAQAGYSSSSVGRTKANNRNTIPIASQIVIEEFMNYHKHNIALPSKNSENVKMSLTWGNDSPPNNDNHILQIGFATAQKQSNKDIVPMNLSLVIDNSGSMADFNKLERVKKALKTFVKELRPTDVLSIVVFSSTARVVLPAQRVENTTLIHQIIDEINTEGSTNIYDGLMAGYGEVMKRITMKDLSHRVILLTDGIANIGITQPKQIEKESKAYTDKGIVLSTIGVGSNVQQELLSNLAKKGKGQSHFIGDEDDVEKIFVNELQSLFSPVAENVKVEIELPKDFQLKQFYGYSAQKGNQKISLSLDNMNNGLTQILMLEGSTKGKIKENLLVHLSYYDVIKKKKIKITEKIKVPFAEKTSKEVENNEENYWEGYQNLQMLTNQIKNKEVKKNFIITKLAEAIKETAQNQNTPQEKITYEKNKKILNFANTYQKDKDIERVSTLLQNYQNILTSKNYGKNE
jgi:Mg-chelatase subunit ChlD